MGGAGGVSRSRASAGSFAPLRSAQNDKIIVILRSAATKDLALARSPDRARLRVRPTGRLHKDGAPSRRALRDSSVPPESQSKAGVPHSGVAATPLHIATANGWKPFGGTTPLRAQRILKGKGLIRKKGKTAGCLPLARSAAAQAAFPPAMCGHSPRSVGRIRKNGAPSRGTRRNGAPSRGPGQLLLDLRSNSPSRALRDGFPYQGVGN